MTIEERTILAVEGEVCPECGQRRIHRFISGVGTHAQRFAVAVVERIACGCVPEIPQPKALTSGDS